MSPRVTYFGELSFTARTDAGLGLPPAPGFNVEVERSLIRFDQSDYFKISFGRYHTPINYWNDTFHHGSWLQTSVSRPEMTQFGGIVSQDVVDKVGPSRRGHRVRYAGTSVTNGFEAAYDQRLPEAHEADRNPITWISTRPNAVQPILLW